MAILSSHENRLARFMPLLSLILLGQSCDGALIQGGLSRRQSVALFCTGVTCSFADAAIAAKDCMLDCEQNCNRVAPRSARYCEQSCIDYCAADDRRDGLSGSVSADGGEVGWLSAYDPSRFFTGVPRSVPYGEDRPPALPDVFGIGSAVESRTAPKK